MVAYSFQKRFVNPIRSGLGEVWEPPVPPKRQTIRAFGKRRHARPGETLQLYSGMRTQWCKLIGTAECTSMEGVLLKWSEWPAFATFGVVEVEPKVWRRVGDLRPIADMESFARADGFLDAEDMARFWHQEHGGKTFEGALIKWKPPA